MISSALCNWRGHGHGHGHGNKWMRLACCCLVVYHLSRVNQFALCVRSVGYQLFSYVRNFYPAYSMDASTLPIEVIAHVVTFLPRNDRATIRLLSREHARVFAPVTVYLSQAQNPVEFERNCRLFTGNLRRHEQWELHVLLARSGSLPNSRTACGFVELLPAIGAVTEAVLAGYDHIWRELVRCEGPARLMARATPSEELWGSYVRVAGCRGQVRV